MQEIKRSRRFAATYYGLVAMVYLGVAVSFSIARGRELDTIEILALSLSATSAAGVAGWLLETQLWKRMPFKYLLGLPDLNGRWEGWYFNAQGGKWLPNAHEIQQRAHDLSAQSWGEKNRSNSLCAALLCNRHGEAVQLVWSYETEPVKGGADRHVGTVKLSYAKHVDQLIGVYWTDRERFTEPGKDTRGIVGYIQLMRVGRACRGERGYVEGQAWGMEMPTHDPRML